MKQPLHGSIEFGLCLNLYHSLYPSGYREKTVYTFLTKNKFVLSTTLLPAHAKQVTLRDYTTEVYNYIGVYNNAKAGSSSLVQQRHFSKI